VERGQMATLDFDRPQRHVSIWQTLLHSDQHACGVQVSKALPKYHLSELKFGQNTIYLS
jgi:hypothetical protein